MKPLVVLALAAPLLAGEYAVLTTGFRVYAERHESDGRVVRLYSKEGGVTEVDAALVVSFEPEETAPAAPPPPLPKRDFIDAAAVKNGLPRELVHSVVAAESAYRADAVSPKGAIGLMQLMPSTAQAYKADPRDPVQNVEAGAAILRDLLLKYSGDPYRALAAYNAGPGVVARYKGVPPYRETQWYLYRVLSRYKQAQEKSATSSSSSASVNTRTAE